MTRIIRDIRFGTIGNFFKSRSPPKIFFSRVPSCSRLAPLPTPVHYVVGHRVRVREHCSRLSCIQSGLPTGRLGSVWTSFRTEAVRVAPRTMTEVTELVRQAVEPRLTIECLFLLDLRLHNVVVALDTNHGWTCAHVYVRVYVYVHAE